MQYLHRQFRISLIPYGIRPNLLNMQYILHAIIISGATSRYYLFIHIKHHFNEKNFHCVVIYDT